jgi:hypothetical protein
MATQILASTSVIPFPAVQVPQVAPHGCEVRAKAPVRFASQFGRSSQSRARQSEAPGLFLPRPPLPQVGHSGRRDNGLEHSGQRG